MNKIESKRSVLPSVETEFKLPVIKGFGFNESPYGKLIKEDEQKAERMNAMQRRFEAVRE